MQAEAIFQLRSLGNGSSAFGIVTGEADVFQVDELWSAFIVVLATRNFDGEAVADEDTAVSSLLMLPADPSVFSTERSKGTAAATAARSSFDWVADARLPRRLASQSRWALVLRASATTR